MIDQISHRGGTSPGPRPSAGKQVVLLVEPFVERGGWVGPRTKILDLAKNLFGPSTRRMGKEGKVWMGLGRLAGGFRGGRLDHVLIPSQQVSALTPARPYRVGVSVPHNGIRCQNGCQLARQRERRKQQNTVNNRSGWVAEWSKAAVLKTAVRVTVPGVRIPPHPLAAPRFAPVSKACCLAQYAS